jgi:cytochrome b6-f complex iron-sulfur subunit
MTDAAAAAPAPEDAPRASQAEATPAAPPLSRREFLNYMWGASMAVFMAGAGGVTVWFALPRFREGEFGGVFTVPVEQIPPPDSPPLEYPEGRFWLVNVGDKTLYDERQPEDYPLQPGVRVLYKVCVHLGCLYKWVPTNDRFECPCHGSKYLKTGARVDGPARRNLDQFITEVVDANGEVLARTEPSYPPGSPREEGATLPLPPGAVALRIDTGRRITGAPNTRPEGGV